MQEIVALGREYLECYHRMKDVTDGSGVLETAIRMNEIADILEQLASVEIVDNDSLVQSQSAKTVMRLVSEKIDEMQQGDV
ncbi:hypothetical protein AWH48_19345 [Domibacillus aminovorans]|uniref:Uncharacterized protein n=2 Tax=Bacillales TaxID=1385 RepID=A0A177KVW7_9BACI|nr:hypothetical protein AWH48_19345 [Domibacillus aminovorans]